jgi:flagellar hook-length control protein FliK
METNRIDLAFALASKNNQVKSVNSGGGGAFADMLLGAVSQKTTSIGADQSQVRAAEIYTPRRRFDDYTTSQFDAHSSANTRTDRRVENSQSRSRWSVDDASTNPGRGLQERGEHVVHHARAAKSQNGGEAQPADLADVSADASVDPATEVEAGEGDRDATIGGGDCGGQDAGQDAGASETPVLAVTAPTTLPDELPAATDIGSDATAAITAGATEPTSGVSAGDASPEEIGATAALAATATLPEAAAAPHEGDIDGIMADGGETDNVADEAAVKQGVTFAATVALTNTADEMQAEAEGQVDAIAGRNEQPIEDAGSSFRRSAGNGRRHQSNGAGAAGGQGNATPQQATAAAIVADGHLGTSASQSATALASGTIPLGFDTGLGNATGLPGWNIHLAQGSAIRRGDFVANLRQHLQNLPAHEQVALSIQRSLKDGGGNITLQLSPAELGRIHLKLKIDEENNVQASVVVERPATLELLQRDMKALERALQEAGLKAGPGDLSFSLQGGDPEAFAREFGSGNGNGSSGAGRGSGADSAEDAPAAVTAAVVDTADGWVDVQV